MRRFRGYAPPLTTREEGYGDTTEEYGLDQIVNLDDEKLTCHFLDGPFRGKKQVLRRALVEGKLILGDTYRVQWNNEDWVWEAIIV